MKLSPRMNSWLERQGQDDVEVNEVAMNAARKAAGLPPLALETYNEDEDEDKVKSAARKAAGLPDHEAEVETNEDEDNIVAIARKAAGLK